MARSEQDTIAGASFSPLDALLALAIGLLFLALYGATYQGRTYGDAPLLFELIWNPKAGGYHNVLYPMLGKLLHPDVLESGGPQDLAWISILSGALGAGLAYPICRAFDARRGASVLVTCLLGCSPVLWFFSTNWEVHALHFAAVALCAFTTLYAPWRRPLLAMALVCATLPWIYLSHISGILLMPAWLFLIHHARARRCAPFRLPALATIALVLVAVIVLCNMWVNSIMGFGFEFSLAFGAERVSAWSNALGHFLNEMVWKAWLLPHAALVPLAIAGLFGHRWSPRKALCLAALILPSLVFFLSWGVHERGAYFLGSAVFLAALAAGAPRLRPALALPLAAGLLAGQIACARFEIDAWNSRFPTERRVALIAAQLKGPGVVYAATDLAPNIFYYLNPTFRRDMSSIVVPARKENAPPELVAQAFAAEIERVLAQGRTVIVDLSYRHNLYYPDYKPWFDAMEAELRRRFSPREVADRWWPLLVVEPR